MNPLRMIPILIALFVFAPSLALAQPAGNSHPQTAMLSARGVENPFGSPPPRGSKVMDIAEKWVFAQNVDLTPLRDLSLYHNGRIKILDSLARESVNEIAGRRNYFDLAPEGGSGALPAKMTYDPLFTYLDIIIDPTYYEDKPLIGVTYLPFRDILIERIVGKGEDQTAARERWRKLGRLAPLGIVGTLDAASSEMMAREMSPQVQKTIGETREALDLYLSSAGNLLMVSSGDHEKPWSALTTLPPDHPARKAALALGSAWRAGDAASVNSAAQELARILPTINSETYPTTRRNLEALYNRAQPFDWGMWLYAGALVAMLLAFGTQRAWLKWTGLTLLLSAVLLHAVGFAARCYIAERFAIQNQFESMTGVSLFAAIVGLALAAAKRQWLFGAATAAVGFMILVVATQTGIPGKDIGREAAILNTSVLLKYHVTTVLFSYGLISLGMICSLFYLGAHYFGKSAGASVALAAGALGASAPAETATDDPAAMTARQRLLHDLDKAQMTILQLAFWTLGVGILLGAWWADHSWGRWWAWDPKETWAAVTWIIYLVVVHIRAAGVKNKALLTAWLSIVGFILMLWCYFGVNLLLAGLHSYA